MQREVHGFLLLTSGGQGQANVKDKSLPLDVLPDASARPAGQSYI